MAANFRLLINHLLTYLLTYYYFYRTNSELLRPGLLLLLSNTQYNDYVSYVYKKMFSFLSRKGCTFRIIQRYRF